ncbi:MAG: Flp pilus assembly protein CpaB [Anaerolineae bacterium]
MKGKAIIFVGVLIGLMAGVLVLVLVSQQQTATALDPTPEPPPVVRAAQNIAKGDEITLEAIQLVRVERGEAVPPSAVRDPMEAVGMSAAMDIPQGTILQVEMYYDREQAALIGKSAASLFQPGRVAMAFPIGDLASVGGALKPGDRVNILASFELAEVDPATQIRLPLDGSGDQITRMAVQTVLQDVEVLRVGPWPPAVSETGEKQTAPPIDNASQVTLLVTPQDSLVLKWLIDKVDEGQARITLALRSEDEIEVPSTEAVTLEYIMRRFNVPIPSKLGVTTSEIRVKGSLEIR